MGKDVLCPCKVAGALLTDSDEASWRSGYAEDCKSLHPGSIPGEASIVIVLAQTWQLGLAHAKTLWYSAGLLGDPR
jgi:hypothetical protein